MTMSKPWAFFCPAERKPLARERLKELGYEVSIDIPHAIPDNSSWVCKHVCRPGVYWEVSPTVTQSHSMPKKIFHLEDLWGDFPRAEKAIKACEHCGYAIRWTSSTTYCSRNCSDEAFRIRGNRCPTCGRMKTLAVEGKCWCGKSIAEELKAQTNDTVWVDANRPTGEDLMAVHRSSHRRIDKLAEILDRRLSQGITWASCNPPYGSRG